MKINKTTKTVTETREVDREVIEIVLDTTDLESTCFRNILKAAERGFRVSANYGECCQKLLTELQETFSNL